MTTKAFDMIALIQKIADNDYGVPEGIDPEGLIPELTGLLGSLDQITRERSYEILGEWAERGHFSEKALQALGQQMAENLLRGLGEEESDGIFLRSYSALVLCTPIGVDQMYDAGLVEGRRPFLSAKHVNAWRACAIESLLGEKDVRSFVEGKGWADAVSHMGDVLHQFARSPHTGKEGLEQILRAIADRLKRPSDAVFVHNEGGRLMRASYMVLLRGELSLERLTAWIDSFSLTEDGRSWGWDGIYNLGFCDHEAVNARANVSDALHSLYFLLQLGLRRWHSDEDAENAYYSFYDRPVPHRDQLIEAVVCVLRKLNEGLPPPD